MWEKEKGKKEEKKEDLLYIQKKKWMKKKRKKRCRCVVLCLSRDAIVREPRLWHFLGVVDGGILFAQVRRHLARFSPPTRQNLVIIYIYVTLLSWSSSQRRRSESNLWASSDRKAISIKSIYSAHRRIDGVLILLLQYSNSNWYFRFIHSAHFTLHVSNRTLLFFFLCRQCVCISLKCRSSRDKMSLRNTWPAITPICLFYKLFINFLFGLLCISIIHHHHHHK